MVIATEIPEDRNTLTITYRVSAITRGKWLNFGLFILYLALAVFLFWIEGTNNVLAVIAIALSAGSLWHYLHWRKILKERQSKMR